MAVLTAAIANGGKVLWPRLVDRIEAPGPDVGRAADGLSERPGAGSTGRQRAHHQIMHDAMLADTKMPMAPAREAAVPGLRICGKTGTAQVQDERNIKTGQTTWFISFAPYEKPRYAVVVMVEDGSLRRHDLRPDRPRHLRRHPGAGTSGSGQSPKTLATKRTECNSAMFDADLNERQSRIDRVQLVALVGLMLLGAAFVYSATMVSESARLAPWYNQSWFRQIVWYVLGTGAAAALCCVDYHTLARWAMIAYWVAVLLLVVVLFFGTVRFGARRWFDLGFFSLQPSEFAKLAFILAQAHFLSRPVEELRVLLTFWKALGLMLLPFVLILKEPDLGSALVLLPTGLAMLLRGRHAPALSGAVARRRRHPGRLVRGGRALRAAELANQIGGLPAAAADGVFRQGLRSASRCAQGGARTPAQAAV